MEKKLMTVVRKANVEYPCQVQGHAPCACALTECCELHCAIFCLRSIVDRQRSSTILSPFQGFTTRWRGSPPSVQLPGAYPPGIIGRCQR